MVPLTTALAGPLLARAAHPRPHADIERGCDAIAGARGPVLRVRDLRNAGFKLAPVDTNLFPGGFNNLNRRCFRSRAGDPGAVERVCADARGVLLIRKTTRGTRTICRTSPRWQGSCSRPDAVRMVAAPGPRAREIDLPPAMLTLEPSCGGRAWARRFRPCMVLLNNDLSAARRSSEHRRARRAGVSADWYNREIADFAELAREREVTDRDILNWAGAVTESWLGGALSYTSKVDGRSRELPRAVAVLQLFNHGTHHRGQLTTLITQAGRDPGETDIPWLPGVVRFTDERPKPP